jgi:hypothetical protein
MWQWEVVSTVVFAVEEQQRSLVSEYAENEEVESRTHTHTLHSAKGNHTKQGCLPASQMVCLWRRRGEGIGGCDRGLAELWVDTKEKELGS